MKIKKINLNKSNKSLFRKISIVVFIIVYIFTINYDRKFNKQRHSTFFSDIIPNGSGVNIHFTGNPIDIDLIKDAGFKIVRQDIFWEALEKKPAIFDFENSGYDELTEALLDQGIRPYYILDYSNSLYEPSNKAIVTKEGEDAFIRYVDEVTSRYKNKKIIWEIWNEPNGTAWQPKPNFVEYASLVKRASKTIKENDPSGTVVAPALAELNDNSLKWLEEIFKLGTLNYIDAISVHPYRGENPETVVGDYKALRKLVGQYSSKNIPILSGEWGYSMKPGWRGLNISEDSQADYLVRMFLINLLSDIPITVWYDWKNDGTDLYNSEHNFGLRQNDVNIAKKSYLAINTMNYILSGFKLNTQVHIGSPNDYVLNFKNEQGETVIVYWTSESKHKVNIPLENQKNEILDIYGKKVEDVQGKGTVETEIFNSPRYIITSQ